MPLQNHNAISFLATAKPTASKAFFKGTIGLPLIEDSDFALVFRLNNGQLRIQKVQDLSPAPYTALGWQVTDIEAPVAALKKKGVTFDQHSGMAKDANGIWTSPSGAKIAWFKDPDGNTLSLTQM
jgi:catechol 2,3-dioxygenase-like lactoylglutathione lyase family enzyme